jgi:hypothetical protein
VEAGIDPREVVAHWTPQWQAFAEASAGHLRYA